MRTTTSTQDTLITDKAEWHLIAEAVANRGKFESFDAVLQHALSCWLPQLAPQLRWQVAVDLYTTEQVSLGRAAEIAGLNYLSLWSNSVRLVLAWLAQRLTA